MLAVLFAPALTPHPLNLRHAHQRVPQTPALITLRPHPFAPSFPARKLVVNAAFIPRAFLEQRLNHKHKLLLRQLTTILHNCTSCTFFTSCTHFISVIFKIDVMARSIASAVTAYPINFINFAHIQPRHLVLLVLIFNIVR
ncbi:hypothetical protein AYI69_g9126 [Smittium culicis]|uniref:Uncharacterized protein n=1 Tax=Smittium culicis TaxID=133412 RepID=A0A1R1XER0_9FUNG|nr:hypothetical protein AYI69_g9126 [Smittium culicis]